MQKQVKFKHHKDFQLGILLLRRNQHMEALDRFKMVLNQFPNKSVEVFIPIYKHLMLHFENHNIRILLAELYLSLEKYEDALDELEDIFESDPSFTQTYYLLSKLFNKNLFIQRIKEIYESAFEQGIYDSSIIDILPKLYLEEKNLDKSIALFSTLITIKTDSIPYHKTLARLFELKECYKDAADMYKKLAQLSPDLSSEAARHCEQLLNHDPRNFDIRQTIVSFYIKGCKPDKAVAQLKEICKMDASKIDNAIEQLLHCLSLFPNHDETTLFLSECYVSKGLYTDAIPYLENLIDLVPDYRQQCENILREIRTKQADHVPSILLQVKLRVYKKTYPLALDLLEEIIKLPSIDAQKTEEYLRKIAKESLEKDRSYFLLASLAFTQKKKDTCLHYCDSLIGSIYDKEVRLFEVDLHKDNNELKTCYSLLTHLLEDYPYDAIIHQRFSEIIHLFLRQELDETLAKPEHEQSFFKVGLIYIRLGDLYHAIETFQKIASHDKNHLRAQLLIGRCFLEVGKYDMAINQLSRTLTLLHVDETSLKSDILYLLSISHHMNGQFQKGVAYLEQILELDINHHLARQLLDYFNGQNLLQLRGKAATIYIDNHGNLTMTHTLNTETDDNSMQSFALPHNDQGTEYLLKQNYSSAEAEFKLAIQMDPNLTVSYSNLALTYLFQEKYKKAHDILDKGLNVNSDLDILYAHKGLVYYKEGDLDKAMELFKKSLQLSPYNEIFQFNVGALYFQRQQLDSAFEWWEKSSQIGLLSHAVHRYVHYLFSESFSDLHWLSLEPFKYHIAYQK